MSSTLLPLTVSQPFVFHPLNDVPVLWSIILGSTWNAGDTPIIDAVGTLTILDPTGTPVPGADAVAFVPTPIPGQYEADIVGSTFNPPPGSRYQTIISLSSPSANAQATWSVPTIIRLRNTP